MYKIASDVSLIVQNFEKELFVVFFNISFVTLRKVGPLTEEHKVYIVQQVPFMVHTYI